MPLTDFLEDPYGVQRLRAAHAQDQGMQDLLGPIEHQQFMEEVTRRNPLLGTILMGGSIPYTALKAVGLPLGGTGEMKSSRPSLDEIFRAWDGYRRGLR